MGRKQRVIIIGAGFAGLAAARTLLAQSDSREVVVLEASSCVGGRCKTGVLPSGTCVELGATWFHGVRDNPVYDVAVWQGVVKDIRCDPDAQKHDIDWQLHFARPLETQLLSGELNNVAMEAVARYTDAAEECTSAAQQGDGSVGDVLRRTYDEAVASEGLQGERLQAFADAWHFREKLQRTFDGFFSTDDVSLAFAREYETLEGPNMPVPGGYQALAEILAQGLDIQFNHRVARVAYGPTGVTVTCDNGRVFEASCCVVTCSIGVLQAQHRQLFDPPLPPWKVEAMQAIRIGVADKVFVEFEIEPARARDAAAWLSSHANLTAATAANAAALDARASPPPPGAAGLVVPSSLPQQRLGSPAASVASAKQQQQPPFPSTAAATQQHHLQLHPPDDTQQQQQQHSAAPSLSACGSSPPPLPPHGAGAATATSPPLPADVLAALPPPATGGLPEPFCLGRRPEPLLGPSYTPEAHAAALAVAAAGFPLSLPSAALGEGSGPQPMQLGGAGALDPATAAQAAAVAAAHLSDHSSASGLTTLAVAAAPGANRQQQQQQQQQTSASTQHHHHAHHGSDEAHGALAAEAAAPSTPTATSAAAGGVFAFGGGGDLALQQQQLGPAMDLCAPPSHQAQQQQRGRRRKHRRTIHSYAFLWAVQRPELLGAQGHPAMLDPRVGRLPPPPACVDRLAPPPQLPRDGGGRAAATARPALLAQAPAWIQGLHSIRYCPGPEWIEPSLLNGEVVPAHHHQQSPGGGGGLAAGGGAAASGGGGAAARTGGKRSAQAMSTAGLRAPAVNPLDGGATHVSGVLWITGAAALAMERASDEEVAAGLTTLFSLFPQVPVPPGAILPPKVVRSKWGTDPHFQGSYSYPVNVNDSTTGDVVDTMAEPLCNDQGVPIVLFAGEATCRPYIGTIHGAFLSGCREAERILEAQHAQQQQHASTFQPTFGLAARRHSTTGNGGGGDDGEQASNSGTNAAASVASVERAARGGAAGAWAAMDVVPEEGGVAALSAIAAAQQALAEASAML